MEGALAIGRHHAGWAEAGGGKCRGLVVCDLHGKVLYEIANAHGPFKLDRQRPTGVLRPLQPRAFLAGRKDTGRGHERQARGSPVVRGRDRPGIAEGRPRIASGPIGLLTGRQAARHDRARQCRATLRRRNRQPGLVARRQAHQHLRKLHVRRRVQPRRQDPRRVRHGPSHLPHERFDRRGDRAADRPSLVSLVIGIHREQQDALLLGVGPGDPPLGRRGSKATRVAGRGPRDGRGRRLARRPNAGLRG